MDMIDRYLAAVGVLLPSSGRADIVAELRDVLLSRREERQAELGRPLTRDEDEALLKSFGHPLMVAGRYGRQQHLIGPELYPLYVFVLRIVLAIVVGSALVSGIVNAVIEPGQPGPAIAAAFQVAWTGSWVALGAVTFVVASLERYRIRLRFLDTWSIRDLKRRSHRRARRATWFDHVAAIVVQAIFLLWWMRVIQLWRPAMPLPPGQSLEVALGPVWQGLYWPVIVLSLGVIAIHAVRLAAPRLRRLGYGLDLVMQAATLALAGYLMRAGGWMIVTGAGLPTGALAKVRVGVNASIEIALVVIVVVAAITAVYDAWRIWGPAPAEAAS